MAKLSEIWSLCLSLGDKGDFRAIGRNCDAAEFGIVVNLKKHEVKRDENTWSKEMKNKWSKEMKTRVVKWKTT